MRLCVDSGEVSGIGENLEADHPFSSAAFCSEFAFGMIGMDTRLNEKPRASSDVGLISRRRIQANR